MHFWTVFALTTSLYSANVPQKVNWLTNYQMARTISADQKKPLVVIVGKGESGWDQVIQDGKLDMNLMQKMARSYVYLYIDSTSEQGAKLAKGLDVHQSNGLIITNRSGDLQAFYHDGQIKQSQMENLLDKYQDIAQVITTTDTLQPKVVSTIGLSAPSPSFSNNSNPLYFPNSSSNWIIQSTGSS